MERLGLIFGGSFEPPHYGHLHLLKQALEYQTYHRAFIVPNRQSPLKDHAHFTIDQKKALIEAFLCDINSEILGQDTIIMSSNIELNRPGKSYTVDTIQQLKHLNPDIDQWILLLGSDSLYQLHQWRDCPTLLQQIRLCVVPREPFCLTTAHQYLTTHFSTYKDPIWINCDYSPCRSTTIRQDPDQLRNQSPPHVQQVIKELHLL